MSEQRIEIAVDIPDGYRATGEFRPANDHEPWLHPSGGVCCGATSSNVIILRKIEVSACPKVPGPRGWPMMRWAAKSPAGDWFVGTEEPEPIAGREPGYSPAGAWFKWYSIKWRPPVEYDDLPPGESLLQLTHTCHWKRVRLGIFRSACVGPVNQWHDTILEGGAPSYCPSCGREVEVVE